MSVNFWNIVALLQLLHKQICQRDRQLKVGPWSSLVVPMRRPTDMLKW